MPQNSQLQFRAARILLPILVFLFSIFVGQYYVGGDQNAYRAAYEEVRDTSLLIGYLNYKSQISSLEIGHFLIIWMFSNWIEKLYLLAVLNAGLAYLVVIFFQRVRAPIGMLVAHLFLNYYVLVLYFSAERLKIAVLFALGSILFVHKRKLSLLAAALSVVSHSQILFLFASLVSSRIFYSSLNLVKTGILKKRILLLLSSCLLAVYLSMGNIALKFEYYIWQSDISDILKILVIFALTFIYSKRRQETLITFIPLFIGVWMFGGDRLNIIAYGLFLYHALQYRRGLNLGLISFTIYNSWKGAIFLTYIFSTGNGFGI